jgi:hypothetical protein
MVDHEVRKIIDKQRRLRALRDARERVRQLERELSGEPPKHEEPPDLPQFLRQELPSRFRLEDVAHGVRLGSWRA